MEVAAVWTQAEETNFKAVLDGFATKTGATYTFTSTGDNIGTVLSTRIAQNNPPDVAILPQPGLLKDLATKGSLKEHNPKTELRPDGHWSTIRRLAGRPDTSSGDSKGGGSE